MTEETTRAAAKKKTSAAAKKKTSSTAAKKKTSTTAKKKTSSTAAKKKTSSASTFRLSAAEKKIITNYRKCNVLMKKLIAVLAEKGSGAVTRSDIDEITRGGMENLLNDQGDIL